MYHKCEFNKDVDIQETIPGLSTSLRLALENGVIMDNGIDAVHNDIEDPSNVWGRISNVFEAIDAQKAILKSGAQVAAPSVQTSQPEGAETE